MAQELKNKSVKNVARIARKSGSRLWRADITVCGFSHTQFFQRRKDARNYINKLKKAEKLCRTNLTEKAF